MGPSYFPRHQEAREARSIIVVGSWRSVGILALVRIRAAVMLLCSAIGTQCNFFFVFRDRHLSLPESHVRRAYMSYDQMLGSARDPPCPSPSGAKSQCSNMKAVRKLETLIEAINNLSISAGRGVYIGTFMILALPLG